MAVGILPAGRLRSQLAVLLVLNEAFSGGAGGLASGYDEEGVNGGEKVKRVAV